MQLGKLLVLGLIILFASCKKSEDNHRFVAVDASRSGIEFANTITENDSINVIDFQYCYNGGGVGIGDFDNNGLPDIIFTGNQVSSALYLNRGDLHFEDITEASGITTTSWVTGVSIVDINVDGLDDIYLSVAGPDCINNCNNLLFINQGLDATGVPTFIEQAEAYGLDDGNYTQQSVFFDYDGDGDLDVFILHNGNHGFAKNNPMPKRYMEPHLNDMLLRNDSVGGLEHPYFTDVSQKAGIVYGGFGLGVGINDINGDGLTDIYVANDFITEDLLYIQRKHPDSVAPWFEERSKTYLGHASHNAMGMDFSDVNNDGLPDIMVVDMLPEKYERQKKMQGGMNYEKYLLALRNDYSSQYVRNTLQVNNGTLDGKPLKTSETGFLSGIASTDWSWSPLLLDLDNDGDKDLYISNGYAKDVADLDYINYASENNMFGSTEDRLQKQKEFAGKLDSIYLPNYIYENKGGLHFKDVSEEWTESVPTYSNGTAYADFDQDGDLDMVLNNINEPATLLENKTSDTPENHFLRIRLEGSEQNRKGIGSIIRIWQKGKLQQQYQSVVRGYLSSMEPIVHFGVMDGFIDSLEVQWPSGIRNKLIHVPVDQLLEVNISEAKKAYASVKRLDSKLQFEEKSSLINFVHKESVFNEYARQPLLMRQYSNSGPCLAAANIDGNVGDELFVGGSKGMPGQIWFQDQDGTYRPKQQLESEFEDTDAVFVDIDGDTDLDLYVTSGSSEFYESSQFYNDRIYLNDGSGYFERNEEILKETSNSTQIVRAGDIDADGDMDFFIGARILPDHYPNTPKSRILINNAGRLQELENSGLEDIGMVTDAIWEDIDQDGLIDLIVVGEWMPISIFKNNTDNFSPLSISWVDENDAPISTTGWWNCVAKSDIDNDGDFDFVLGNQGLNGVLRPSASEPIYVYKNDYDRNGSPDPVLGRFMSDGENRKLLPLHSRDDIVAQLPSLKRFYMRYDDFTKVDFEQLLNIKDLTAETLSAQIFASSYAENLGNGRFRLTDLPSRCQVAPINDILVDDFDKDGQEELLLVGNDFTAEAIYGRADAFTGIVLKRENGSWDAMESKDSGFYVPGQSNHLLKITDNTGDKAILAAQNNDTLRVFSSMIPPESVQKTSPVIP
ncbi:hypothetical protein LCGC14_0783080 [marine sediment metagenome]|uniref:ASPIC/UnbV domain-containing protein n=2 Tax=root TaxID=1 RepID=A0A831QV83_9FLAO|nr:hypothetical protein [Pricia antarctica]